MEKSEEYRRFVAESAPLLLRAATLLAPDTATAEDFVQTVFVRLARRWPTARRAPLAYARRVLLNVARDESRRRSRRPTSPLLDDHLERADHRPAIDPGDRLEVVRAVRALPDQQRAVVVLRYFLDRSVSETASDLSIPEGTVKSTASRALAQLAAVLADPVPTHEGGT